MPAGLAAWLSPGGVHGSPSALCGTGAGEVGDINGAPGYGDVGAYAGHVSGGPDVYIIPKGTDP